MKLAAARGVRGRYQLWRRQVPAPVAAGDNGFERLVGAARWRALPLPVRQRFARKVAAGACVAYLGEVVECRINMAGRLLANLARLVGGPLPLFADTGVPACVSVTEDVAGGGQFWTRQYGRRDGFPQVIFSAKRFAGPTGLEEYLGLGFGIALRVAVDDGILWFLSDHYFLRLGRLRLRIPDWLRPGDLAIGHVDCGGGRFAFTLALTHPLFGGMIRQVAIFTDPEDAADPARLP